MIKISAFIKRLCTTDRIALYILFFGIIGMLVLPYFITQLSWGLYLNVNKPNEIGDTLGGILSPFIGLVSAFLVYLALRSQIEANNLIKNQFKEEKESKEIEMLFDKTYNMLIELVESLDNFTYGRFKGFQAYSVFMNYEFVHKTLRIQDHLDKKFELLNLMDDIQQLGSFFLEHPSFNKSFCKIFYFRFSKVIYFFNSLVLPDLMEISKSEIHKERYIVNEIFKKLYDLVSDQNGIKPVDFSYLEELKKDFKDLN